MGACEKRREDGARSLTDGTTPTAARVNMRCGFWRDLSPIGAKWALFPGLSCTWNGLREEIAYFGRYNSPSAKFAALLPNLVCNYLPSSQEGCVGSPPPPLPHSRTLEILIFLLPLPNLSRRHFGTNVSLSFHLLTHTFLS